MLFSKEGKRERGIPSDVCTLQCGRDKVQGLPDSCRHLWETALTQATEQGCPQRRAGGRSQLRHSGEREGSRAGLNEKVPGAFWGSWVRIGFIFFGKSCHSWCLGFLYKFKRQLVTFHTNTCAQTGTYVHTNSTKLNSHWDCKKSTCQFGKNDNLRKFSFRTQHAVYNYLSLGFTVFSQI